jgi:hypothetical protein
LAGNGSARVDSGGGGGSSGANRGAAAASGSAASVAGDGTGVGGSAGAGGGDIGPSLQGSARPYSLRAIYFRREMFRSTADCLTAAYAQHLPLEVCR